MNNDNQCRELTGKEVIELLRDGSRWGGAMVRVDVIRMSTPVYDDNGEEYADDVYLPLDYVIGEDGEDHLFGIYESAQGAECTCGLIEEDIKGEIAYNGDGVLDLWIDRA